MSTTANVSGQAYALMVMTPITPGCEDELRAYLEGLREDGSPLAKLPRTHLGRWVIVEDFYCSPSYEQRHVDHLACQYLIFTSNLDGPVDTYLDELCEKLAPEAAEIWGRCVGCPDPAAGPALKSYLRHNQIDTGFFFAAYGHATVPKVRAALAQRDELIAFAVRTQGMAPADLQSEFMKEFGS